MRSTQTYNAGALYLLRFGQIGKFVMDDRRTLPLAESCDGCGDCCLHMGYPAFMLPRKPASVEGVRTDAELLRLIEQGWTEEELLTGHAGESHWHRLPDDLRAEWEAYVSAYESTGELDRPCFWFDSETRRCRHHQYRPQVCRDFEIGSTVCKQWRQHYRDLVELNDSGAAT